MRNQLGATCACFRLMRAMIVVVLLCGLVSTSQASGWLYWCNCNIAAGESYCSCDSSEIEVSPNPFSIAPMATPEFGAVCRGHQESPWGYLTAFPRDPGLQLNWTSKSVTCTVLDVGFCISNGDICRDCTNWSFTKHNDVTISSIQCIPYKP